MQLNPFSLLSSNRLFILIGLHGAEIQLTSQPDAVEYKTCGQDAEFNWQHSTAQPAADIKWYQYDASGNVVDEISNYNGSLFVVNEGSSYQAAKEKRIEYIPNAGIRIKNIKHEDEGTIGVEVDFVNVDHSDGETQIFVTGIVSYTLVKNL